MPKRIVTWFLFVCLTAFVKTDDHGENAVSFTKESFSSSLTSEKLFVMFFAPWCGHCKRLAPTWDDLAMEVNVAGGKVKVGKVDCTLETSFCSEHGVRGYPTIKFFSHNTEGVKYAGKRTIEDFRSFLEEQLGKEEAENAEKIEEKKEEMKVEEETAKALPVMATNGLYELTDANFEAHVANGHHFIKFFAPWCAHCKHLAPTWEELAKNFAAGDKVKVAKVDCTVHSVTCSKFSIRGYPTLVWVTNGEKSESYTGSRTLGDLQDFIMKMTSVKSEAAKTSEDGKVPDVLTNLDTAENAIEKKDMRSTGDVYDLTDSNFDAHILKGHHFIKFFAPWCGHCIQLAPTWEKLPKIFADGDVVKIAKVDCTVQTATCGKLSISGYPTLLWFTNGEKVQDYQGQRTIEDLSDFVNKMTGEVQVDKHGEKEEELQTADAKPKDGLYELTDANFQSHVAKGNHFIKFYAPWCGHCQQLAPTWETLAKFFIAGRKVKIGKVDCTIQTATCSMYSVNGYPTLLWFSNGQKEKSYNGPRTIEDMSKFINEMAEASKGAKVVDITTDKLDVGLVELTDDDFEESITEDFTFVLFDDSSKPVSDALVSAMTTLGEQYVDTTDVMVAKIDCKNNVKICSKYDANGPYPQLRLFQNGALLDSYNGKQTLLAMNTYLTNMVNDHREKKRDEL